MPRANMKISRKSTGQGLWVRIVLLLACSTNMMHQNTLPTFVNWISIEIGKKVTKL